jgi:hypothetical protein
VSLPRGSTSVQIRCFKRIANTYRQSPDANCLLSVTDHCLRSRNYVNVVVAGKQPAPQWLTMDEAVRHCEAGLGIWEWASNDKGSEPGVVMACCGDVPTLETLAAVDLLRKHAPDLKVLVINVVEHPHGVSDHDFDALFTADKPIIFAFHGYPWLIHRLAGNQKFRKRKQFQLDLADASSAVATATKGYRPQSVPVRIAVNESSRMRLSVCPMTRVQEAQSTRRGALHRTNVSA